MKPYSKAEQLGKLEHQSDATANFRRPRMNKKAHKLPPVPDRCQKCGGTGDFRGIVWHHITKKSQGGTDDKSNLVAVCGSCHSSEHRIVEK